MRDTSVRGGHGHKPRHEGGRAVGAAEAAGEGSRSPPGDSPQGGHQRPEELRNSVRDASPGRKAAKAGPAWGRQRHGPRGPQERGREKGGRKGVREKTSALNFVLVIKQN